MPEEGPIVIQNRAAGMWDQLKKDARKLEGELEVKLTHFSRLCTGLDSSVPHDSIRAHQGAKQIALEINSLLHRLESVHGKMEADVSGSDIRQHTVARHRDIMLDYSQEFRRLNSQLSQAKDRAKLLAGTHEVSPLLGVTVQSNTSSLIRERNNIQASTSALDGVLAQAGALGNSLHEQRGLFDNIGAKLMSVGSRFPVVNGLMNAIRRRKSWDTVVLTSVVVVCSLFLLFYLFRKWL